jgi:hypothetical protein
MNNNTLMIIKKHMRAVARPQSASIINGPLPAMQKNKEMNPESDDDRVRKRFARAGINFFLY